ncbi:unnamed protein product [Heligmosomoides polygyrus]|uniref:Peroxidase n=1 Tax=Heligmosomoides polygyrus TaxID=6339 RepID=A0A183FFG0_HELPZ|nr:unnamed protein product [Heligmosomoides polygyrus]
MLRDLNESIDVPSCVKLAFNVTIDELEKVRLELDKLSDENKELGRRLGISPDDELNSIFVTNGYLGMIVMRTVVMSLLSRKNVDL